MFRNAKNKPLNIPTIFYTPKNTIEKPPPPENERKKFKFFQKNGK